MAIISVRIDEETRRKMKLFPHLNWSEIVRRAIMEKIREEERKGRMLDPKRLKEAVEITDRVRRPSPSWSSVEEIRKWRDLRK